MPESGATKTDWLVALSKGIVGGIPLVGPLVAEVVGTIIPNQRIDRLERFLAILDAKVGSLNQDFVRSGLLEPEFVDLLEDGFNQAARSLTDERREHIASVLKNSLTNNQLEHLQKKRLLALLGEINDLEILILRSHATRSFAERERFKEAHPAVAPPPALYSGPKDDHDRQAVHQSYLNHLVQLDLLRPTFVSVSPGKNPEFDPDTGTLRKHGYRSTPLGELLLRMFDLDPDGAA